MLVVINPSGEEAGFAYNGKLTVPGASAVFVREQA